MTAAIRPYEKEAFDDAVPVYVLDETRLRTWVSERGDPVARWVESLGFEASPGKLLPVPGDQ
ncbi:MAG: hypothetical protein U9R74_19005, partial [Pseudomonadota bacterium]|nr:hypothetical protein [Pseudomonadota bacterium]